MSASTFDDINGQVAQNVLAGKFDDALKILADASRAEPSSYAIKQSLGDLYRTLERPDEAIRAYDDALAIEPTHSDLWAKRGDALIDLGDRNAAIEAFKQASRLAPDAFTERDWNLRGDRFYSYGDYEMAGWLYESGLKVKPNAEGWRGVGLIAAALGRTDDAIGAYSKGLELDRDHAELLNDLGLAYRDQGMLPEALELFQRLVARAPEWPIGWLNLAVVSRETGHPDAAREACLRLIDLTPDDPEAWLELGMCELELDDVRGSLGSFERVIELDPYNFWGWNNAGWACHELGQYDAALERLDRAIELDSHEITPWSNKVWALLRNGELDRAETCVSEMLEAVDDLPEALRIKGGILADWTFNFEDAVDALREASSLKPGDVLIESDLAEALLKVGDYSGGREAARASLREKATRIGNVQCGS